MGKSVVNPKSGVLARLAGNTTFTWTESCHTSVFCQSTVSGAVERDTSVSWSRSSRCALTRVAKQSWEAALHQLLSRAAFSQFGGPFLGALTTVVLGVVLVGRVSSASRSSLLTVACATQKIDTASNCIGGANGWASLVCSRQGGN